MLETFSGYKLFLSYICWCWMHWSRLYMGGAVVNFFCIPLWKSKERSNLTFFILVLQNVVTFKYGTYRISRTKGRYTKHGPLGMKSWDFWTLYIGYWSDRELEFCFHHKCWLLLDFIAQAFLVIHFIIIKTEVTVR